ncbi:MULTISPECIES: hypothetical protein [unclassified Pseudomonas]|uniref:hypothetical protein n=1 Tax=unclassified Pseudomonas TaxID=196821 RepID=UPI000BCC3549|nr:MULTISPECIES: hypothetical protein [unclassified Pseudomonas]PVZ13530.1 hypothetical protein F474_02611 [Pseudomonas sp. URIL14HWK12:I12]PVZ23836.1 hypothetical protein F470_02266 [Pseudomonas sp. URIL14HWK12:I10]PVZ33525.1 hypothetical protein F472_02996 [Pseudomonas sp. URIL14HWK12:I11]SNZ11912.1 hypothetical protein SAMN05660463_01981 [Pseudomonas sp. URIL14HWK12:I9]
MDKTTLVSKFRDLVAELAYSDDEHALVLSTGIALGWLNALYYQGLLDGFAEWEQLHGEITEAADSWQAPPLQGVAREGARIDVRALMRGRY